jgi:hypothetical protein
MLPKGWPFPGKDMSRARFDQDGNSVHGVQYDCLFDNDTTLVEDSQVNGHNNLSEQQHFNKVGTSDNAREAQLSELGTSLKTSDPLHNLQGSFTSSEIGLTPQLPPQRVLFPAHQSQLPPPLPPETRNQHYPAQVMQFYPAGYPVGRGQGQSQALAQAGLHMMSPQIYPTSTEIFSPPIYPQDHLGGYAQGQMVLLASPAQSMVSPVPAQYQQPSHQLYNQSIVFQAQPVQQQPQMSITQPYAMPYRFHVKGTPPFIDATRDVAPSEKPVIVVKNVS